MFVYIRLEGKYDVKNMLKNHKHKIITKTSNKFECIIECQYVGDSNNFSVDGSYLVSLVKGFDEELTPENLESRVINSPDINIKKYHFKLKTDRINRKVLYYINQLCRFKSRDLFFSYFDYDEEIDYKVDIDEDIEVNKKDIEKFEKEVVAKYPEAFSMTS